MIVMDDYKLAVLPRVGSLFSVSKGIGPYLSCAPLLLHHDPELGAVVYESHRHRHYEFKYLLPFVPESFPQFSKVLLTNGKADITQNS